MEFGEYRFPKAEEREIAIRSGSTWKPIDRYKAIVSSGGHLYAIVSENYKLIQHRRVAEVTNEVMREFNIKPLKTMLDFSIDGAVMFYKLLVDEMVIKGERLKLGLMVTNSYDLSVGINVLGFGLNMYCMNEMILGREFLKIKKRPLEGSVGLELERFKKAIEEILDKMIQVKDIIKASVSSSVSFKEVIDLVLSLKLSLRNTRKVIRLIGKYTEFDYNLLTETIMNEEKRGERLENIGDIKIASRWQVYNALTDFITHHLKTKDKTKTLELHNKAVKILAKIKGG